MVFRREKKSCLENYKSGTGIAAVVETLVEKMELEDSAGKSAEVLGMG